MITLTDKQAERMCDHYCRFPYNVEEDDLEAICEGCPMSGKKDEDEDKVSE